MLGPQTGCTLKNKSKSMPFRQNKALMGSLGFEPRLPTPQAGILDQKPKIHTKIPMSQVKGFLDQARLRPQQPTKYEAQIINTLIKLKNSGRCENTNKTNVIQPQTTSQERRPLNPEHMKTPSQTQNSPTHQKQNYAFKSSENPSTCYKLKCTRRR
jgi:hypothetical protein